MGYGGKTTRNVRVNGKQRRYVVITSDIFLLESEGKDSRNQASEEEGELKSNAIN